MNKGINLQRNLLEKLRGDLVAKSGGKIKASDIRPHVLKVYGELKSDSNNVRFELSEDVKINPCEILLSKHAQFFANLFGLQIHPVPVAGDTPTEFPGNSSLVTYPDPRIFDSAAHNGGLMTEASCLEVLYNSEMSLKTGQGIRLEDFSTGVFRRVPQTQEGPATIPSMEGHELIDIASAFMLSGDRSNEISVSFPKGSDYKSIEGDERKTRKNYAVLLIGGFIVVNAANAARIIEVLTEMERSH